MKRDVLIGVMLNKAPKTSSNIIQQYQNGHLLKKELFSSPAV